MCHKVLLHCRKTREIYISPFTVLGIDKGTDNKPINISLKQCLEAEKCSFKNVFYLQVTCSTTFFFIDFIVDYKHSV